MHSELLSVGQLTMSMVHITCVLEYVQLLSIIAKKQQIKERPTNEFSGILQ